MPPKDKYYNRHAAEARERDDAKQSSDRAAKARAAEDAKWVEDDKRALKKAAAASDQAAKDADAERRRQEKLQQLADEERENTKVPTKVSKKAMQRDVAKLVANYNVAFAQVRGGVVEDTAPLPTGNVNAGGAKGGDEDKHVVASGVDASIDALGGSSNKRGGGAGRMHMPSSIADRHIGRRARVQFKIFQQDNMAKLKEEKPNLRITQYNDLLWERWQKSPLNPFVQRAEARAAEAVERERSWMFANDSEVSDSEEQ